MTWLGDWTITVFPGPTTTGPRRPCSDAPVAAAGAAATATAAMKTPAPIHDPGRKRFCLMTSSLLRQFPMLTDAAGVRPILRAPYRRPAPSRESPTEPSEHLRGACSRRHRPTDCP